MPEATADARERRPESGLLLVLCTDPDLSLRIVRWLDEVSINVVQVFDSYHTSRLIEQNNVTAIMTDRLLPPWPGLDAFALLRKSHPKLAVIYVRNEDADIGSAILGAGATHVLPRPLRRQSVLDALPPGVTAA